MYYIVFRNLFLHSAIFFIRKSNIDFTTRWNTCTIRLESLVFHLFTYFKALCIHEQNQIQVEEVPKVHNFFKGKAEMATKPFSDSTRTATDRTWVIMECWNKEGFFLEITEVLSEVRANYFSNFWGIFWHFLL